MKFCVIRKEKPEVARHAGADSDGIGSCAPWCDMKLFHVVASRTEIYRCNTVAICLCRDEDDKIVDSCGNAYYKR